MTTDRGVPHVATLPWRGRVGLPKAVRGGVAAAQWMITTLYMRKRCHPLPARWRGPTSPLQGEVTVAISFFPACGGA